MKVLIIEDEYGVAKNLCDILQEVDKNIEILAIIETVKESVKWIESNPKPDLGFFDIRLADGDSFKIFEQIKIEFPVIFTTAYDQYALKAFKVNSIDYILKPVDKKSLEAALNKYESFYKKENIVNNEILLRTIEELRSLNTKNYKKTFLIHNKDRILPLSTENIAFFYLQNDIVYCMTHDNKQFFIDQSLDKIEGQVNPEQFFRANRQYIISRKAVKAAVQYFQRKLKLDLSPTPKEDVFISKTKAYIFKKWLEI